MFKRTTETVWSNVIEGMIALDYGGNRQGNKGCEITGLFRLLVFERRRAAGL